MRRTLAIVLAAGLLFAGGCDRARSAAPPPASSPAAPAAPAPARSGPAADGSPQTAGAGDVDSLLDQVDQQLSDDARPAEDED